MRSANEVPKQVTLDSDRITNRSAILGRDFQADDACIFEVACDEGDRWFNHNKWGDLRIACLFEKD
jgi:hypothetical protein